jgi:hypothetical protein
MMWLTTPKLSHSRKGGEKEEFSLENTKNNKIYEENPPWTLPH